MKAPCKQELDSQYKQGEPTERLGFARDPPRLGQVLEQHPPHPGECQRSPRLFQHE